MSLSDRAPGRDHMASQNQGRPLIEGKIIWAAASVAIILVGINHPAIMLVAPGALLSLSLYTRIRAANAVGRRRFMAGQPRRSGRPAPGPDPDLSIDHQPLQIEKRHHGHSRRLTRS